MEQLTSSEAHRNGLDLQLEAEATWFSGMLPHLPRRASLWTWHQVTFRMLVAIHDSPHASLQLGWWPVAHEELDVTCCGMAARGFSASDQMKLTSFLPEVIHHVILDVI